jgi:hypothetical protein
MYILIRITIFSFSNWLVAALVNSVLYAFVFCMIVPDVEWGAEAFMLAFAFSLIFSAPAAFIYWIVFIASSSSQRLPAVMLRTSLVLSAVSCLFIAMLPNEVYKGHWFLLSLIVIISALSSVLLHHGILSSFNENKPVQNV